MTTAAFEFSQAYRQHMNSAPMRAYYGDSEFFNVGYWTPRTQTIDEACARLVTEVVERARDVPRRVLDVGCGPGGTTRSLAERWPAASVIGADLAPYTHARDGLRAGSPARFVAMDACALALPASSVDIVVSIEAAFHFDSRRAFFHEARRVLRPGGTLLLTDILFSDASAIGNWMVRSAERPADPREYAELLGTAGFIDITTTDATDCSWSGFCRHWIEWMEAGARLEEDPDEAARVRTLARRWQQDTVRCYLIGSAVKGSGGEL